ncbi:MAG TPA: hypothetical protein DD734_04220 [Firmicutes bacterium]|nr:hypothetical protein [Bacillota bacterium]HBR28891.1 hypothetical protein [Bacillota bacterium]HBR33816.1 hypothetical protein [Bacillota bacterium]
MRKALIIIFSLLLLVIGAGGILLPIVGYIYGRELTVTLFTLSFPFFPFFGLPLAIWLLITGGGLIMGREWAWYSVQTFWTFLLCTGVLLLSGLNLLLFRFGSRLEGTRLCLYGNLGLGLLLIVVPVGGLVLFGHARKEFRPDATEVNPWSVSSDVPDQQRPWG